MYFASADGDALIIVTILAVALAWSVAPQGVKGHPSEAGPGDDYFVVFGDSYISGEGAEQFLAGTNEKAHDAKPNPDHTNECRRAPTAWPFVLAGVPATPGVATPSHVSFLACSGAVTENIHTEPRLDAKKKQHGPAELKLYGREHDKLGRTPKFAVISIGGTLWHCSLDRRVFRPGGQLVLGWWSLSSGAPS